MVKVSLSVDAESILRPSQNFVIPWEEASANWCLVISSVDFEVRTMARAPAFLQRSLRQVLVRISVFARQLRNVMVY